MELHWWVSVIELPALVGLFGLVQMYKASCDKAVLELRTDLAAYKVLVATTFASTTYVKDIETRIITHLQKIEDKIDRIVEGRMHGP
jgi:hypothetical protein